MAKDCDSEDDCVFGPPESCSRACRIAEIFHKEGLFNPLIPIIFFGKGEKLIFCLFAPSPVPTNNYLRTQWVKDDEEVQRAVETSKALRELEDCRCESEECFLPKDDWVWDHPFVSRPPLSPINTFSGYVRGQNSREARPLPPALRLWRGRRPRRQGAKRQHHRFLGNLG